MKRETLYSDHKFYSLGLFHQKPKEFTTLPDTTNRFLGFSEFDGIYSLQFNYSLNSKEPHGSSKIDFITPVFN